MDGRGQIIRRRRDRANAPAVTRRAVDPDCYSSASNIDSTRLDLRLSTSAGPEISPSTKPVRCDVADSACSTVIQEVRSRRLPVAHVVLKVEP